MSDPNEGAGRQHLGEGTFYDHLVPVCTFPCDDNAQTMAHEIISAFASYPYRQASGSDCRLSLVTCRIERAAIPGRLTLKVPKASVSNSSVTTAWIPSSTGGGAIAAALPCMVPRVARSGRLMRPVL